MLDRIVLVSQRTRLEGLLGRYNTKAQAKFYLEHNAVDYGAFEAEDTRYKRALAEVQHQCRGLADVVLEVERGQLPQLIFAPSDVVIAVGRDGLVVNTASGQ